MKLRAPSALRNFLDSESAGGLVLMAAAATALVIANSPAGDVYFATLKTYVLGLSVLHWINDALMALFFLLVGLEIKREFVDGELSSWPRRVLPGIAAAGGMAVPAIVYLAFNMGSEGQPKGWAIPAATDIAFALGVLSLLGSRVPVSLKVFLTAVAIMDDVGAVLIIALFYTEQLSLMALGGAAAVVAVLVVLNMRGVHRLWPYLMLGAVLWAFVLFSGIHATIAGVVLALTIPLRRSIARPDDADSPLHILEHALAKWVAFLVVPVFGFANAGVPVLGLTLSAMMQPVPLGILLGLFVGKQVGIFASVWIAVRTNLADLPAGASWGQVYGVALLCGIGFTMSLFIGLLAFYDDEALQSAVKLGVLAGSLASALVGTAVLLVAKRETRPATA